MFIGEYQHTVDSKNRIIIPSKFRDELGVRFILTKGLDACLFVYSLKEWERFEEKLKEVPMTSKEGRAFTRHLFSSAIECDADKQGRLTIPQHLRTYAGIEKELVTIGVNTKIEIWDKKNWENYQSSDEVGYEAIFERMAEFGI